MTEAFYSLPTPAFTQKKNGYDDSEVDEWIDGTFALIERVNAEVSSLREQLARAQSELNSRSSSGDQSNSTSELDETLRRTLVLAQKTADAAIKEAQEDAARMRSEAQDESQRVVADANEAARKLAQDAQQQVRADVLKLEAARTELSNDVNKLRGYLEEERERVRTALSQALDQLDKGVNESHPSPSLSNVQIPAESTFGMISSPSTVIPEASEAPSVPRWATDTGSQPSTARVAEDINDDEYMAELRRAMTDPEPLGPRADDDQNGRSDSPLFTPPTFPDLTGPVPTTAAEPQTADFSAEDFYTPEDGEDDPGFGGRLRRRR